MQKPGEVEEALKQLITAVPGALVECLKCGQNHVDKHVLSPGARNLRPHRRSSRRRRRYATSG